MEQQQEVLLEVGPPGTGALPRSLLVSMKPGVGGAWDMEIAVDTTLSVESVLVSPDGAPCLVNPLSPTQTGQGIIHYCTISVQLAGPGLIVEVLGPGQVAVPELAAYLRPDRQRSFPLVRLPPGPSVRPSVWGPPGAQRWEAAVNLVGAWKSEMGAVLDFLVDDSGAAAKMAATVQPSNQSQQSWLAPQQVGLINPSLARLWLPAGTTDVEVSFLRADGTALEGYQTTIALADMPVVDPVSANLAAPRPAPRMGSLITSGGRYHESESTHMNEAPAAPPSFPARPVFAPNAGHAPNAEQLHHTPPPGSMPAVDLPPPVTPRASKPRYSAAGIAAGPQYNSDQNLKAVAPRPEPVSVPLAGAEVSSPGARAGMNAIRDLQNIRRRTNTSRMPKYWPDSIGQSGPNLGPMGPMTGRAVISLLSVERSTDQIKLELYLDDHGLVASIALASDGGLIAEQPLARITTFSPTRVTVTASGEHGDILLLARNSYGEVYQNLAGLVDAQAQSFREIALDQHSWSGVIQFAQPLSLETTLCCACRRELKVDEAVEIYSLSPSERNALRSEYPITPDARALCKPCHEDTILSRQWLHILATAFSGPNLRLGLQRLVFAYAGGLLTFTPFGLTIVRVLLAISQNLEERAAYAGTAGLLAFVAAVPPWPTLLSAMQQGWRTLIRSGRVVGAATLGVPAVLGIIGWAAYSTAVQPPEWYASRWYRMDLHVAVGIGFMVTLLVVILTQRIADTVYEARLALQRKMVQMGHASRLIPRLMGVGDMLEFDRAIDRVLMEGLGALEYQVFAMNPDAKKFRLKRAVGPLRHQVTGMDFKAGDEHVLGICAQLGRPLTQQEIATDKSIHPGAKRSPIPSLAVLPIWVRGEVAEIYNISRFRGVNLGNDLTGLMNTITVVAGRGLTDMLRAAEKAEREAKMASTPVR